MAVIALAYIGSAIGGALAAGTAYAAVGAAIGYAVGSYIGNAAFGPKAQGAQLADLKAATVSYGATIQYIEGHPRVAGNVIWQSEKRATEQDSGGKGGGGGGATSYTYDCDLLLMLAENQLEGVRRCWSNSKLVWSIADDSDDDTVEASDEADLWEGLVFYNGAPTQLPDPTYEAAVGVGNAPAYRGRSTLLIKGLQLGSSGQLPNLTFEISGPASESSVYAKKILNLVDESDLFLIPPTGGFTGGGTVKLCVVNSGKIKTSSHKSSSSGSTGMQIDDIPPSANFVAPGQGGGDVAIMVMGLNGNQAGFAIAGSGYSLEVLLPDPGQYIGGGTIRWSTFGGRLAIGTEADIGTGAGEPAGAVGNQGAVYLYSLDGELETTIDFGAPVTSIALAGASLYIMDDTANVTPWNADDGLGAPFAAPAGSGQRIFVSALGAMYCVNAAAHVHRWDGTAWVHIIDLALDPLESPVNLGTGNCRHMVSGSGDVYAVEMVNAPTHEPYRAWWHNSAGFPPPLSAQFKTLELAMQGSGASDAVWEIYQQYYPTPPGGLRARRNATADIDSESIPPPPGFLREVFVQYGIEVFYLGGEVFGHPIGYWEAYPGGPTAFYLNQFSPPPEGEPHYLHNVYRARIRQGATLSEPALQDVVERLSVRAGLTLDQIDATELASKNVHALAVTQVSPTRSTIEMLMGVYGFYCVESGGVLVFRFKGAEPVRTIPFEDAGATTGDAPVSPVPLVIGSDLELPSVFSVRFMNIDDDYQDGLEPSDRLLSSGQSTAVVDAPIGLTPTEAKRLAVVSVQTTAAGKIRIGPVALSRENAELEPGDSIVVTRQDGSTLQGFVQKLTLADGVYTLEAVSEDTAAYSSDAVTAGNYTNSLTVRKPPDSLYQILDTPLLSDDTDGPGFLVHAKGSRTPWPGYVFQRSPDDNTYTTLHQGDIPGIFGSCTTTLADWMGPNIVDEISRVTVDVGAGQLFGVSRVELLSSRFNLAMVGAELLQFQRATLVSAGVYELSGLVRYLGGTDRVVHASAEPFALLKSTALTKVALNLADEGISRYYRAVTIGRSTSSATGTAFAPALVSMMPLAPANPHAVQRGNGDVVVRWSRRTRYQSNALRGIVPLGEAAEAYTVKVYAGATLLRTLLASTTDATYSAANQASDGAAGTLTLEIRQTGAVPGHAATVTKAI